MRRPAFVARQARHATGLLGRIIATIMARETWSQNRRAIDALRLQPDDHVLDIGCGPGRSLAALADLAPSGRVVGIDPSATMLSVARKRNRTLTDSGRVEIVGGEVARLPFPEKSFDKALCVHVVYFWEDRAAALREIARVLKPGGRLALLFRAGDDGAAAREFPAEVYRFPDRAEMAGELVRAGFGVEAAEARDANAAALFVCIRRKAP